MDTLAKGRAKEIPDPGVARAGETETCLVDISEVNGLDISMRLVQNAELHRRLERNARNNLSNLQGVYYLPDGFMSFVQSFVP